MTNSNNFCVQTKKPIKPIINSDAPLEINYQPIADLRPYPNNPRTHTKKQIRQIANSIQEFKVTNPILRDEQNQIIAGHGRVEALKLLGVQIAPTICLNDLTEEQKRAYIIADNKIAENADWDIELLTVELIDLLDSDQNFDITLTGFEMPEIDMLIEEQNLDVQNDPADDIPQIDENPASRLGDIWQLGKHRLICGDALQADTYEALMQGELAQMIFTDPPYNVEIHGNVCGLGKVHHDEFTMASGEMTESQFRDFLSTSLNLLSQNSIDGSIHFICMDWRHIEEIITAGNAVFDELKNLVVWNKNNGGMGSLFRSKHELIPVFKKGTAPHINNVELGKHWRNRTNVWDYPGVNTFRKGRLEDLASHPTVKPVALVSDAMLDCSHRGRVILDSFCGSGTTIIAAEKVGRVARAIELEPKYVDVAIKRWQELTGLDAILAETGTSFTDVSQGRNPTDAEGVDHE